MKDGVKNWLSSKLVTVNLFALLFTLTLFSTLLPAQTSQDTCLTKAQDLARNPQKGSYRSFFACAITQSKTKNDSLHVYYEVGRRLIRAIPIEAHPLLDTAILLSAEDDIRKGRSWQYKAYMYEIGGQFLQAEQAYKQAFDNYERNQASPKRIAGCAKSLGNIYTRFSDYEKAIHYLQKAVNGYREANSSSQLAMSLSDLARAFYWEGDVAEANIQAKSVLKIDPLSDLELGLAKDILGTCLFNQKHYAQGIQVTREAIQHFLTIGYAEAATAGYRSLGETYLSLGKIDSAKSCYQQAWLQNKQAYGNQHRREVGQWHIGWGNMLAKQQEWDAALLAFQQALYNCLPESVDTLDVKQNFSHDHIYKENVIIQALEGKASCWIEKYKQSPEEEFLTLAIDALDLLYETEDKFRKSYDFESSRLKVGALRHPRVELSLWAMSRLKDKKQQTEQAFAIVESSKALGLLEELKNDQSRQSVLPEGIAFRWNVQEKEIQGLEEEIRENPSDSLQMALQELQFQHQQFIDSLEALFPQYYQFKYDYATITSEKLQSTLPANQTFIEYFYGDQAIYAFKVSASGLEFYELDLPDSVALATLERSLRSNDLQAVSPAQYAEAAYKLHQQLLAPLGELSARLIIVPDRALARIPFDALIAQQPDAPTTWRELPYLIHDRSVAYAWSATLLNIQQENDINRKGILSISPVYFDNLAHLTAGKSIGPHLQSLWSKTQLLQETDATKSNFLQHLQQTHQPYQIINLYTHAKADSASPGQSWISFRDDQPDALLYLNELYHLQLNAQLAVLGACETGIGKEYRGEGLMSFARGFTYAGCQSILSTLWSSDEQATASLLQTFFTKLEAGATKDVALADSKRGFLDASSERRAMEYHPRLWASLMMIGDSQEMESGGFAWWWGLVILLAVGLIYWRMRSRP